MIKINPDLVDGKKILDMMGLARDHIENFDINGFCKIDRELREYSRRTDYTNIVGIHIYGLKVNKICHVLDFAGFEDIQYTEYLSKALMHVIKFDSDHRTLSIVSGEFDSFLDYLYERSELKNGIFNCTSAYVRACVEAFVKKDFSFK